MTITVFPTSTTTGARLEWRLLPWTHETAAAPCPDLLRYEQLGAAEGRRRAARPWGETAERPVGMENLGKSGCQIFARASGGYDRPSTGVKPVMDAPSSVTETARILPGL